MTRLELFILKSPFGICWFSTISVTPIDAVHILVEIRICELAMLWSARDWFVCFFNTTTSTVQTFWEKLNNPVLFFEEMTFQIIRIFPAFGLQLAYY